MAAGNTATAAAVAATAAGNATAAATAAAAAAAAIGNATGNAVLCGPMLGNAVGSPMLGWDLVHFHLLITVHERKAKSLLQLCCIPILVTVNDWH
jgi:hypothetical protein